MNRLLEEMERVRQRYLSVWGHFPKVAVLSAEATPDNVRRQAAAHASGLRIDNG